MFPWLGMVAIINPPKAVVAKAVEINGSGLNILGSL